MQRRTTKVALLAVLAIALVVGLSAVAFAAPSWRDLPDSVTAKYGITDNQVAAISEGYASGVWKPFQGVTRAQFTKMAVAAFKIPLARPAIASYTDVPRSNQFFPYIEAAKASGIVAGTTATTFSPNLMITRQQAIAIVSRYIAKVQGFNLATMYTAADIETLLAHFGDASLVSADLRDEVAFAFDMGITTGDDYGNVNPLATLMRIQAAAFLIRAQGLVPPQLFVPANLELVSADKTEGLIGQVYSATFRVTTADGHPAKGVLVDFDALVGPEFYVGKVEPEASVTDNNGEVTVDLLSLEPGTMRVAATVNGVGTVYITRYWLALDEVYTTGKTTSQNNAGVEHTWGVRVVVFGPGPRSTSQSDWYNAIDADFDPTNINVEDGIDAGEFFELPTAEWADNWTMADEAFLATKGFTPRSLPGIEVEWAIYNGLDDPSTQLTNEALTSVGSIVGVDGRAITPARWAVGKTDAAGFSSISIVSEQIGTTLTKAVADYPGNPYPEQLLNHLTFNDWQQHNYEWDDQPAAAATQKKTWISHTIGGKPGPIVPASDNANIGEEKTLTITLVDGYGNPVEGREVEWYMQGVGFFNTDDAGDRSDTLVAANNKDFDTTDAAGQATVFVKSFESGEQIVHAKVRDKGTGGMEGGFIVYTAEVQWFDVDIATFDDIRTQWVYVDEYTDVDDGILDNYWLYQNESLSSNPVDTSHTFDFWAYGLKLEYTPMPGYPDGQTWLIDSDASDASYDGIFDWRDAEYFGGVLMFGMYDQDRAASYDQWIEKMIDPWGYDLRYWDSNLNRYVYSSEPGFIGWLYMPFDFDGDGKIEARASDPGNVSFPFEGWDERGTLEAEVAGRWIKLSYEGAFTGYDHDDDPDVELFTGVGGIYLPLAGKTVTFTQGEEAVGSLNPDQAVTDAAGKAQVTVTSQTKGLQRIAGTVDWEGNPHDGPELLTAYAAKSWVAGTIANPSDLTIEIYLDDTLVATNKEGKLANGVAPFYAAGDEGELNRAHVTVHVKDAYGNDLPDYEVVYLLLGVDSWLGGSQNAVNTRIPFAYLTDFDPEDDELGSGEFLGQVYDENQGRPDSDEPMPDGEPYGKIVGSGGTEAFFFNQWLTSEKRTDVGQAGLARWWGLIPGLQLAGYQAPVGQAYSQYVFGNPEPPDMIDLFDGFDGFDDDAVESEVRLATDGAKAWTRDGYFRTRDGRIIPNLATGSSVDIQLAEDEELYDSPHYKSILRVMVYAPADGLVQEGAYVWSYQVHQVWEVPVPTTITLMPAEGCQVAGLGSHTVVATVRDQFGSAMEDVSVSWTRTRLEGDLDQLGIPPASYLTGADGTTSITLNQNAGNWGVEEVVASVGDVKSNTALVQWAYDDRVGEITVRGIPYSFDLVSPGVGGTQVVVAAGFTPWSGLTIQVANGVCGAPISTGTYTYSASGPLNITTGVLESAFAVHAIATSNANTDERPNWVYDMNP